MAHESTEVLLQKLKRKAYLAIKDRLRAIVEGLLGSSALTIAQKLRVGERSVKRWVKRWNEQGEAGLWDLPRPGQPQRLTKEQQEMLFRRVEQGPPTQEGRGRDRLIDLCAFVKEQCGVVMKKGGMQNLLFRHGYRVLRARPVHEKNEATRMEVWKKQAPLLSRKSSKSTRKKK